MIKNIYKPELKRYYHNYYCDYCFKIIINGEINRNIKGIENNIFDLCLDCKGQWEDDTEK